MTSLPELYAQFWNTVFSSIPVVGFELAQAEAAFVGGLVPVLLVASYRVYEMGYTSVKRGVDEFLEIGVPVLGFASGLISAVFLLESNPLRVFIDNVSTAFFILVVTGGLALVLRQAGVDSEKYLG